MIPASYLEEFNKNPECKSDSAKCSWRYNQMLWGKDRELGLTGGEEFGSRKGRSNSWAVQDATGRWPEKAVRGDGAGQRVLAGTAGLSFQSSWNVESEKRIMLER